MALPTLNLIGPGRLGQSLAHLWHAQGLVTMGGVAGRDAARTAAALAFIGAGRAYALADLPPADLTLFAVPDDHLAEAVGRLPASAAGRVAFHCSGALSSAVLAPLRAQGCHVASVHPLKSFAQPALAVAGFEGTRCACEGDAAALDMLGPLFDGIGARRFALDASRKTLYHAGAVLACNDLVALMEAALRCMAAAGVPSETAWPALRPLIDGTLANLDRLPPSAALTGPIARGDAGTVARQQAATAALDPAVADVYRTLGRLALQLAKLDDTQRHAIAQSLEGQL